MFETPKNTYGFLFDGYPTRLMMLGHVQPDLKPLRNSYDGVEDYLAAHSNLLLEDFLHSLRKAIHRMQNYPSTQTSDDVWVYRRVTLTPHLPIDPQNPASNLNRGEITCKLKIHPQGSVDQRQPEFGHLLVFSRGSFDHDLFLGMIGSTDYDYDSSENRTDKDNTEETDDDHDQFETCPRRICDHNLDEESDGDADDFSGDEQDCEIHVKKDNSSGTGKKKANEFETVNIKLFRKTLPKNFGDDYYVMLETRQFFFMYYHVLRALNMFKTRPFPLKNIIVHSWGYNPKKGVYPTLGVVSLPKTMFTGLFYAHAPETFRDWLRSKMIEFKLNESQCRALRDTFNSKLTLIQGPPGTGKTYFGAALVKIYLDLFKDQANLGVSEVPKPPFLIVCQTNHALDNILKKLLGFTDKIVRVGGECKSLKVTPYCLTEQVCRNYVEHRPVCPRHSDAHSGERFKYICRNRLQRHLDELHTRRKDLASLRWEKKNEQDAKRKLFLYQETKRTKRLVRNLEKDIPRFYEQLPRAVGRKTRMDFIEEVLMAADVIGMTTTGAAVRSEMLMKLQVPFVVIEEAAAVLESHAVISLTEHCKCLVMLGDHKQLQPSVGNHLLEKYGFNISLFERLINNGYPARCLNPQYRMSSEISALLKGDPYFYENLEDGPGTIGRPPVEGLTESVIFFDHHVKEEMLSRGCFWNPHEVKILMRLATHLVTAGHLPSDLAIISMYNEQKKRLIQARDQIPILGGLEIATVDSFQGREKNVILVSLVRSNKEGNIGFLKKPNRVCVALSRAKFGLFLVGNLNCLTEKDTYKVWATVKQRITDEESFGYVYLVCRKHQTEHLVSTMQDWSVQFCPQCPRC